LRSQCRAPRAADVDGSGFIDANPTIENLVRTRFRIEGPAAVRESERDRERPVFGADVENGRSIRRTDQAMGACGVADGAWWQTLRAFLDEWAVCSRAPTRRRHARHRRNNTQPTPDAPNRVRSDLCTVTGGRTSGHAEHQQSTTIKASDPSLLFRCTRDSRDVASRHVRGHCLQPQGSHAAGARDDHRNQSSRPAAGVLTVLRGTPASLGRCTLRSNIDCVSFERVVPTILSCSAHASTQIDMASSSWLVESRQTARRAALTAAILLGPGRRGTTGEHPAGKRGQSRRVRGRSRAEHSSEIVSIRSSASRMRRVSSVSSFWTTSATLARDMACPSARQSRSQKRDVAPSSGAGAAREHARAKDAVVGECGAENPLRQKRARVTL
jgi:hypothetical protein